MFIFRISPWKCETARHVMSFRYNFTVKSILITYGKLRTKTVLFHSWRLRNASVVVQVLLMRFRGRFLSDKIWFGANVKCFLTLLCQGFFSFSPPINFLIWECIRSTWKKLRSFHWCRVIYLTRKVRSIIEIEFGCGGGLVISCSSKSENRIVRVHPFPM